MKTDLSGPDGLAESAALSDVAPFCCVPDALSGKPNMGNYFFFSCIASGSPFIDIYTIYCYNYAKEIVMSSWLILTKEQEWHINEAELDFDLAVFTADVFCLHQR